MKFNSLILVSGMLLFSASANAGLINCFDTSDPAVASAGKTADSFLNTGESTAVVRNDNCGPWAGNDVNDLTAASGGYGFDDWLRLDKVDDGSTGIGTNVELGLIVSGLGTINGSFSFNDVGYDDYLIALKFDGVYSTFLSDSAADFWLWGTDPDGDGGFDLSHLTIYARSPGSSVPEPAIAGLLSIGLLAMVVARRRMKV